MRQNQYQEIVFRATAYIKKNVHRTFSVSELAKHLGFTERYVLKAFRKVLNRGVVEAIRDEKINHAKTLLQKTQMEITSISYESGFGDYGNFARIFRRKVGVNPTEFRKKISLLRETPIPDFEPVEQERRQEWFRDSFRSQVPGDHWKPAEGEWCCHDEQLQGRGASTSISFLRPLPENCRIFAQIRADSRLGFDLPDISLSLSDDTFRSFYCQFSLAFGNTSKSELRHFRYGHRWNQDARLKDSEWNDVVLEINDDQVSLALNGSTVFSFRDAFPSPYFSRCHVIFSSFHCSIRIRKLSIHNLGFLPVIRPIRQGDALYNSGLFERAMQFYLRYLQAGSATDEETMELRHKIGMCCLRMGALHQAKGWMDKVVNLSGNRFWAEQTRTALLELNWKEADTEMLIENMGRTFTDPAVRDQTRVITLFAVEDYVQRGFFKEAERILQTWCRLEAPGTYAHQRARRDLADHLQRMRRFGEAEAILAESGSSIIPEFLQYAQLNRMQLFHEWGRIRESEAARREIENRTQSPYLLVRCRLQEALNLRAEGRLEEAATLLGRIPSDFPETGEAFLHRSQIHRAHILCCLERFDEGRVALEEARRIAPKYHFDHRYSMPYFLAEQKYATAAKAALDDYRIAKDLISTTAELGIKAGILLELAGLSGESKSILKEVSLRFPENQVRFFGPLAAALLSAEEPNAFSMPYEHFRRSELFCLLGLLTEKRGITESARTYFEQSVADDPALRWPAHLSRKRLRAQS